MFVCLYFGLLALGCLLLFEDAAVYFKKHCTNKHKRNLPSRVTTVNTNTGAFCRYKQTHEEGNMKHRYPTNSRANTPLINTPHNTFLKLERLSVGGQSILTWSLAARRAVATRQHTASVPSRAGAIFAIFGPWFYKSSDLT